MSHKLEKIKAWLKRPECAEWMIDMLFGVINKFEDAQLEPSPEHGFYIRKGDEINSILIAALRSLNQEQLCILRDNLIARTPQPQSSLTNEDIVYLPIAKGETFDAGAVCMGEENVIWLRKMKLSELKAAITNRQQDDKLTILRSAIRAFAHGLDDYSSAIKTLISKRLFEILNETK